MEYALGVCFIDSDSRGVVAASAAGIDRSSSEATKRRVVVALNRIGFQSSKRAYLQDFRFGLLSKPSQQLEYGSGACEYSKSLSPSGGVAHLEWWLRSPLVYEGPTLFVKDARESK